MVVLLTKGSQMQEAKMQKVTAAQARQFLERSTNIRTLRASTIDRYLDDMREGRWAPNSVLHFDEKGNLLDGFHRLTALQRWGGSAVFVMVCGEKPEDVEVIDTGASRTMGDLLRMRGEAEYNSLAAVIRLSMQWERIGEGSNGPNASDTYSRRTMLDWLDTNGDVRDAMSPARSLHRSTGLPIAVAGAFVFRAHRAWGERVPGFIDAVCFGKGDDVTQGAMALQRVLRQRSADLRSTDRRTYLALTVKGWNYHLTERDVDKLVWLSRRNEPFPRMLTKSDITKGRRLQWEDEDA